MTSIGPALGFISGAAMLRIYVDFDKLPEGEKHRWFIAQLKYCQWSNHSDAYFKGEVRTLTYSAGSLGKNIHHSVVSPVYTTERDSSVCGNSTPEFLQVKSQSCFLLA